MQEEQRETGNSTKAHKLIDQNQFSSGQAHLELLKYFLDSNTNLEQTDSRQEVKTC